MFSQWRSKRHFPMDAGSSAAPMGSQQPTTPFEADQTASGEAARATPPQQHHQMSSAAAVKAFGKASIAKAAKFRPSTREGATGSRSPMSFAAGPRSNSRGANSLEFGGGVVPDDPLAAEADTSASAPPSGHALRSQSKPLPSPTTATRPPPPTTTPSTITDTSPEKETQHSRLASIGSLGSFEDFRSIIAFSSASNLLEESPALTVSTDYSSPGFPSAVAAAADKQPLAVVKDKAQPPLPPLLTRPQQSSVADVPTSSSSNGSLAPRSSPRKPVGTSVAFGPDEPAHLRPQSIGIHRRSAAPSVPETVSQPGSSQFASEEFHSPGQRMSSTDAMRRLEDSIREGSGRQAAFGLGISSQEDADATTSGAAPGATRNAHTKTSSDMSGHSSGDSWGRTSFGRDTLRMLGDSDQLVEGSARAASLASSKTQKTQVSDSGHSTNTAETSADIHDSDQLSTIKERTESPESMLKRHISMDSSFSLSQNAEFSDARTSRASASSSGSIPQAMSSPLSRPNGLQSTPSHGSARREAKATDKAPGALKQAQSQSAVSGIGSPTFGFRRRQTSHSSTVNELLPPLELEAAEFKPHARTASNASASNPRTAPLEPSAIAGLRRGSAGVLSGSTGASRSGSPYTTPLPSMPFPTASSTPLFHASFARGAAAQASEPNTPNLSYDAALAKAVGKERKVRPTALVLSPSALSAMSPLSPSSISFKGLASPGKPRAPPPSAPPTDPLPPIPNTPSFAPKSPNPLQRDGSWNTRTSASSFVDDADSDPDPLNTPKGSRSRGLLESERSRTETTRKSSMDAKLPASSAALHSITTSDVRRGSEGGSAQDPAASSPVEDRKTAGDDNSTAHRPAPTSAPAPASASATAPASAPATASTLAPTPATAPAVAAVLTEKLEPGDDPKASLEEMDDISSGKAMVSTAQKVTRVSVQPVRRPSKVAEAGPGRVHQTTTSSSPKTEANAVTALGTPRDPTEHASAPKQGEASVIQDTSASNSAHTSESVLDSTVQSNLSSASQTQGRRTAATEKPMRAAGPPPSAWGSKGRVAQSQTAGGSAPGSKAGSDAGHDHLEELRNGAESVASCHSTLSTISDRRREIMHDKEVLLKQLNESERQEILRRTEGRFAGAFTEVAAAFRQLQADKLVLEQIIREKTPLSGAGANNEMLSSYLSTMNAKVEHSNAEIRKLLDLLEQQREVIEQMMATHQLEKETYEEDLERLRGALDEAHVDVDRQQATIVRLNEELARAHTTTVQANAEAMRARTTLVEEGRKRDKVVQLLRQAKQRLREVETETLASRDSRTYHAGVAGDEAPATGSEAAPQLGVAKAVSSSSESEVAMLRRLLEERDHEIASLRLGHADAVMQEADDSACSVADQHSERSGEGEEANAGDEMARLRVQIQEQKEREKQIRTAYMYVRDELRKANLERRRSSSASISSLAAPASGAASPFSLGTPLARTRLAGHEAAAAGERPARLGTASGIESANDGTPVKLKRLSLPIVARAAAPISTPAHQDAHPPSSFRALAADAPEHARRHSRHLASRSPPSASSPRV